VLTAGEIVYERTGAGWRERIMTNEPGMPAMPPGYSGSAWTLMFGRFITSNSWRSWPG